MKCTARKGHLSPMDKMSISGERSPDTGEVSEYQLTWNNYNSSIISFLKLLTPCQDLDNSLSDVTLSCAGLKTFQAHRLVLVTCSTYFRYIFLSKGMVGDKGTCLGHPIVFIPDLSEEVLELILGFMYKGEITVPSHLIIPLMEAARLLGVQGLTEPVGSSTSSESQISPETRGPVTEAEESNLVIHTKLDSEPEDLSQADSEDSEKKTFLCKSEPEYSTNEELAAEVPFPDSTKPLFSKYGFPTLTPLPSSLAMSVGLSAGGLGTPLHRNLNHDSPVSFKSRSSPSRSSKSPRLLSPSSTSSGHLSFLDGVRSFPTNKETVRSYLANHDASHSQHYPKTQDPSRPFGCPICPKRFRMKHHLKEHSLIHSGEMPFSCHLCPKRFNRSYTLKNHMKLHSTSSSQEGRSTVNILLPLLSHPPSFP